VTQVDFYVLEDGGGDRLRFTCRLVDKAYGQGRRVYIHAGSDAELQQLDRLLWTFRDQSFIPHGPVDRADTAFTPVLLGRGEPPQGEDDVLINLAAEVPGFFSRFQRVAEIVDTDEQVRQAARDRYRYYQERGYPLDTHRMHR
jgi:DNA polymerase-3 subunit chi